MLNSWMRDPEAFSSDYEEYRQLLDELATPEGELPTPDLFDLVDMNEEDEEYPDEEYDPFLTDAEADADALASIGWGTDEDYGYYGGEGW